jgi:hypothetical protein
MNHKEVMSVMGGTMVTPIQGYTGRFAHPAPRHL